MPAAIANPVYANVAFFRIAQFDTRPVSEQALLKNALEQQTREAIARVRPEDRVVLDAEDGLALVLFGDQERALDVTQSVQSRADGVPLHAGLNYGPLALSSRGADARVFGDGLTAAAAAARFATPARVFLTQDFARALEATSPERAVELESAGEFTDTRVRLHSFYTPDARRRAARRRQLLFYTGSAVLFILILGVVGREAYQRIFPPAPAIVKLLVKPRGEIFVDGVSRGRTPPLTEIQIPAGKHVLQVRNPGHPPLELALELKAGEQVTITHTFGRDAKPSLWRDFKKRFGF